MHHRLSTASKAESGKSGQMAKAFGGPCFRQFNFDVGNAQGIRWEVTDFPIRVDLNLLPQVLTLGSVHSFLMRITLFTIVRILKTLRLRIAFIRQRCSKKPFWRFRSFVDLYSIRALRCT